MGKYIRKSRSTSEVTLMDISLHAQPSLGVCTRAKALALRKKSSSAQPAAAVGSPGGSYLQLRSRRLEKPPILVPRGEPKRYKQQQSKKPGQKSNSRASSRLKVSSVESKSVGSASLAGLSQEKCCLDTEKKIGVEGEKIVETEVKGISDDGAVETSFGENVLEYDGGERSTRETTPCSLIRNPDCIRTPGSTTRPSCLTEGNCRTQNSMRRNIPTSHEMDEFFAGAEENHQKKFIEKYNFDPVKDVPLPGRYQWEKMDP